MGIKIHNIFHVYCLNKVIGNHISVSYTLPHLDFEEQLVLIPNKILRTRERRLRSRTIKEYLVQWKDLPSEEATWEDEFFLQNPKLSFIEDKKYWVGSTVMSPSKYDYLQIMFHQTTSCLG